MLRAIREAVDSHTPGDPPTMEEVVERLGPLAGVTDRTSHVEAGGAGAPPESEAGGGRRGRRRRRG